ncbi:MAG: hypothetical protein V3575_05330 [Candidatus Absconditabacteria bacterium]
MVKKVNGQLQVQQLKRVETSLKENKDIIKNVNSQVQSGEYITTTDKRGGKTKSNSPDNLVAEKEANIKSLEVQKKDIETKKNEKDRPPNTGNERPFLLGGMIPLSQLFESGTELEEYEKVRDTIITEALTKQGAQNLLNNTNFNIIKKEFIDNYLTRQSTQLIIEQNRWNIDTVRKGLEQDFDNMILQLGGVEEAMNKFEGDELERKKQAIKEMFILDEDKRLGEVIVGMYEEYINIFNNNQRPLMNNQ